MTWGTTAYTHSRARPVHGAKVLGCGWPETSVTPDSEGRVPREVVVERAGKQLHDERDQEQDPGEGADGLGLAR